MPFEPATDLESAPPTLGDYVYAGFTSNSAEELTKKRFDDIEDKIPSVIAEAKAAFESIKSVINIADFPDLWKDFAPAKYTNDNGVEIDISKITFPVLSDELKGATFNDTIQSLNNTSFTPSDMSLTEPELVGGLKIDTSFQVDPFNYEKQSFDTTIKPPNESDWQYTGEEFKIDETVLDLIKHHLEIILSTSGIVQGTDLENAIWDRMKDKVRDEWENEWSKTNSIYASAGWDIPNGSISSVLQSINNKSVRAIEQMTHEQTINLATLARDSYLKALDSAIKLEQLIRDSFERKCDRYLNYIKTKAEYYLGVFKSKIDFELGKVEHYKASAQAYTAYVQAKKTAKDAELAVLEVIEKSNAIKLQKFEKEYLTFKAKLDSINSLTDNASKLHSAKVNAFAEELKGKIAVLNSEVENKSTQVKEETARLNLMQETNKNNLQMIIAKANLALENMSNIAKMYLQWLTSMYASINLTVSQSAQDQHSTSANFYIQETKSSSKQIEERHNFEYPNQTST